MGHGFHGYVTLPWAYLLKWEHPIAIAEIFLESQRILRRLKGGLTNNRVGCGVKISGNWKPNNSKNLDTFQRVKAYCKASVLIALSISKNTLIVMMGRSSVRQRENA